MEARGVVNALTIDVEDYYHVSALAGSIPRDRWPRMERRVVVNTHRLLDLLDGRGVRATFFCLGVVAEEQPTLIREIHDRGHEVACHGYAHDLVYRQTPETFRDEVARAKGCLEEITGTAVRGYRAASYSITRRSLWALDLLHEAGFAYDSSIFPIHHDRYGIPDFPRFPHRVRGTEDDGLMEFPLTTARLFGRNLPVAGGGYLRLLPAALTRWGVAQVNRREGKPAILYLHPWEIDPDQPRQRVGWLTRIRHYHNLDRMEARLVGLLERFHFDTAARVLGLEEGEHG